MKLKCKINEKEYDIVQGASFSEEYNETLDSGTIRISHEKMIDIKPYDDVYIWDSDYEYTGYRSSKESTKKFDISVNYTANYTDKDLVELNGEYFDYVIYMELSTETMENYKNDSSLSSKIFQIKGSGSSNGMGLVYYDYDYVMSYNNIDKNFYLTPIENDRIPTFIISLKGNRYVGEGFFKYKDNFYFNEGLYEKDTSLLGEDIFLANFSNVQESNNKIVSFSINENNIFKSIESQNIILKYTTPNIYSYTQQIDIYDIPYKMTYIEKQRITLVPDTSEDIVKNSILNYLSFDLIYNGEKYVDYIGNSLFKDISIEEFSVNGEILKDDTNIILSDLTKEKIKYISIKKETLDYFVNDNVSNYELVHSGDINNNNSSENVGGVYYSYSHKYLVRYIKESDTFEFYQENDEDKKIILTRQGNFYNGEIDIPDNYSNGTFSFVIQTKDNLFIRDSVNPISYEYIDHEFEMSIEIKDDLEKVILQSEDYLEKIDYNIIIYYSILGEIVGQTYNILYDDSNSQFYLSPKYNDSINPILNFDIYLTQENGIYKGGFTNNIFDDAELYNSEYKIYYKSLKEDRKYFYKHFLVDSFSENMINLQDLFLRKGVESYEPIYEYTIQLFSETKGLEVVQLPNISITEPLNLEKKISVWEYLNKFVNMYSPKFKTISNEEKKTWTYTQKYHIDESLKDTFENVYSPDFSLNNPNLRDVLSKLMITKDRIPYVEDDIIKAMDITQRKSEFKHPEDYKNINYVSGSMSSGNYCDNLKKTYSEALSKDSTTKIIDYIGFRNSDVSLMTIENMRLETRFPIYKINKIYMCYYKKVNIFNSETAKTRNMVFLCKQDITPLVKLNTERNALKADWNTLNANGKPDDAQKLQELYGIKSLKDLSNYKMMTVGYDIGSNKIEGWGTKYTYPIEETFWDSTKTYVENIFNYSDMLEPYGIYGYDYFEKQLDTTKEEVVLMTGNERLDNMISPDDLQILDQNDTYEKINNNAIKLKALMFQVDYQAFYNGTTIHSKDMARDNVTINDNPSASLTLLEQDGLYTKEKANRFGNKGLTINARYDDISEMKELGSVFKVKEDDDIIIYHREYRIWDNFVTTVYYGMHDYVLKNFYTSVYARHRTWNLMSYGESVKRAENRKAFVLLSKENSYYEENKQGFDLINVEMILSFFKNNLLLGYDDWQDDSKLNYGIILHNGNHFITDINAFINGYSLIANLTMFDNSSMGTYISVPRPKFNSNSKNFIEELIAKLVELTGAEEEVVNAMLSSSVKSDYTGSKQDWHMVIDNEETGFINELGIYIGHQGQSLLNDGLFANDEKNTIVNKNYNNLFSFPLIKDTSKLALTNKIGKIYEVNKDNKEIIDFTFQIEPITNDNNVLFSSWIMRLSDLLFNYKKVGEKTTKSKEVRVEERINVVCSFRKTVAMVQVGEVTQYRKRSYPIITLIIPNEFFENNLERLKSKIAANSITLLFNSFSGILYTYLEPKLEGYEFTISSIGNLKDNGSNRNVLTMYGRQRSRLAYKKDDKLTYEIDTKDAQLKLIEIKNSDKFTVPEGYRMFSTSDLSGEQIQEILPENERTMFEFKGSNYGLFSSVIANSFELKDNRFDFENSDWNSLGLYGVKSIDTISKEYNQNNFIVVSDKEMKKTIVYDEYKLEDLNYVKGINPENIMFFEKSENYAPYLKIDIRNLENRENIKSVQHWYYNEEDKSCHFVFGVNLNEKEQQEGIVKVYTSIVSLRDTRVYDEYHNEKGKIANYKCSSNIYGTDQYYEELKEQ